MSSMSTASIPLVHSAQAWPSAAAIATEKRLMKMDVMRKATRTAPSVLGVLWSMGLSIASLHFSSVEEELALSRSWRTAWARLNVGGNLRLHDVSPSVTLQTPKNMLIINPCGYKDCIPTWCTEFVPVGYDISRGFLTLLTPNETDGWSWPLDESIILLSCASTSC